MNNKKIYFLLLFIGVFFSAMAQNKGRIKQSINEDWKFCSDDVELAYAENFNDSTWKASHCLILGIN